MSSLTPPARVILGMLKLGIHTGYDIKKAIDTSTRFFWGASFGQIYPELRRLSEAGLIKGKPDPRGQVKRTMYSLTPKGERALHDWLTDSESFTFEMRDESLLRLFFGDALSREEVVANLHARVVFLDMVLERFREIEVDARTGFATDEQLYPYLALQLLTDGRYDAATVSRAPVRHRAHHLDARLVCADRGRACCRQAATRDRAPRARRRGSAARDRRLAPRQSGRSRAGGRRRSPGRLGLRRLRERLRR